MPKFVLVFLIFALQSLSHANPSCTQHIKKDLRHDLILRQSASCLALELEMQQTVQRAAESCILSSDTTLDALQKAHHDHLATLDQDSCQRLSAHRDIAALSKALDEKILNRPEAITQKLQTAVTSYNKLVERSAAREFVGCYTEKKSGKEVPSEAVLASLLAPLQEELTKKLDPHQDGSESLLGAFFSKGTFRERLSRVNSFLDRHRGGPLAFLGRPTLIAINTLGFALINRHRGGWMPHGSTQMARMTSGLMYAGLGYLTGGYDGAIAGGLLLPGMYLGWGKYMDMGTTGGTMGGDFLKMSARGLFSTLFSGTFLWARGYGVAPLLSGAAQGPCYLAGHGLLGNRRITSDMYLHPMVDGATSFGELCSGAVYGAGQSASILYGKPLSL